MHPHSSTQPTPTPTRPAPSSQGVARLALALATVSALGACGDADDHILGTTRDTEQPSEAFYLSDESFVGRWLGEAREPLAFGLGIDDEPPTYVFPSGSARIVLELASSIDAEGNVAIDGTLTFGAGESPPPATDATSGYPVGFSYDDFLSYGESRNGAARRYRGMLPPLEGFDYPLDPIALDGGVPDGLLQVAYDPTSYLAPWCALQPPHPRDDGTFGVLPYAPGGIEVMSDGTNRPCSGFGPADLSDCPADMDQLPRDEYLATYRACSKRGAILYQMSCDRMFLSRFCSCEEDACSEAEPTERARLSLRASDDGLIGAFESARFLNSRGLPGPLGEVRFVPLDRR
ncbi:MAG TPA: hypothetical protein VMG12_16960 [Polyangiaceae bacterium]|nr:hypothetical protein [Polyangiaceae bacterium]